MSWFGFKSEEERAEIVRRKIVKKDEIARLRQEHDEELQRRDRILSDHKRIIAIRDSEIAQLRRSHGKEIQSTLDQAQNEKNQMTATYTRDVENLKNTYAIDVAHFKQVAQAREDQLITKHQQQHLRSQQDIEELNDALLTRDDEIYQSMVFTASGLPQMPDDKIRDSFLQIQQMVEELGRRPWKQGQQLWPQLLLQESSKRHPANMVRKAIVQDMIWSILFQNVFCSPFRVFGDAGKKLEDDWNESCVQDKSTPDDVYSWPIPGVKTERWRIMTVKACHDALREPLSQMDQRAEVKVGYQNNLTNLIEELQSGLESLCEPSDSDLQLMKHLSRKAARLWLDFGLHRCRIRIYLPGQQSKTTAEKVALAEKNRLMLTRIPTVGRYGNDKGVDLESFTTINGCTGESIAVP